MIPLLRMFAFMNSFISSTLTGFVVCILLSYVHSLRANEMILAAFRCKKILQWLISRPSFTILYVLHWMAYLVPLTLTGAYIISLVMDIQKRHSTRPKHGFLIAYVHSALEIVILTHVNLYNKLAKEYNMHSDIFQVHCLVI